MAEKGIASSRTSFAERDQANREGKAKGTVTLRYVSPTLF